MFIFHWQRRDERNNTISSEIKVWGRGFPYYLLFVRKLRPTQLSASEVRIIQNIFCTQPWQTFNFKSKNHFVPSSFCINNYSFIIVSWSFPPWVGGSDLLWRQLTPAPWAWRVTRLELPSSGGDLTPRYTPTTRTSAPTTTQLRCHDLFILNFISAFVAYAGLCQGQGQTGNLLRQTLREDPAPAGCRAGDEEAGGEVGRVESHQWDGQLFLLFRDDSISTSFDLDSFLVRSFSQQIKESNVDTGKECDGPSPEFWLSCPVHTQNKILRGCTDNTNLHPKLTSAMLRDHYVKELHLLKARGPVYA